MSAQSSSPNFSGFSPWRFALMLALLIFAAFPQVVLGLESFVARDFGFFAYPLAHFQRDCFWRGEIPFWNPYNNCGVPFLAQWNTMPLYPPSLIYLTLPLRWSLSFFSLLHLWWAGLGMYFLARRWSGNNFAAAFAGTAFAFNGFILNLLMWPSHIATFSWMPWVILAVEAAWRDGGKRTPLAAFAGAMQMLAGGPETIFLTWLIVFAVWLQQLAFRGSDASSPGGFATKASLPRFATLWRFPLVVLLVISLSVVQLLPFLDFVAHAQRETGYTDLRWSMPASGLANFLVPMAFGNTISEGIFFQHGQYWTSSYYLGIGTLWLALLSIFGLQDRWQKMRGKEPIRLISESKLLLKLWSRFCADPVCLLALILTIGLLCALGDHTPFYPLLRKLIPQLSFITYPVKFVMVVVFAAPLLAAFALANYRERGRRIFSLGFILFLLIAAVVIWTQLAPQPGDDTPAAKLNGISRGIFLFLTGAVLWLMNRNSANARVRSSKFQTPGFANWTLGMGLILVAWLDVSTHEPKQNPSVPPTVFEQNLARTKLAMNPQPKLGGSRAMLSPAAALELTRFAVSDPKNNFLAKRTGYCANANLLDDVPKVDGFFSLTPREFDVLLSLIYSETNADWSRLEDFMGVSQATSATDFLAWQRRTNFPSLVTAGQKPVFREDTNTLWMFARNDFDGSKVVFLPPDEESSVTVSNETSAKILQSKFENNSVDFQIETAEPSLAVIAQTFYHDWHAEIDGQRVPLLRANVAFQAVQVPAGTHKVHLFYRDRVFEIGAAISICMWVNCFVAWMMRWRRDVAVVQKKAAN